ncbi:MAG TPA: glycosyl transferase [Lentisphaeria bacterium]|nr:MAG: glycosyl transferase [Lentisphaerae bacterium GWF2_50_93]HCE45322.1 glycosyl transferase [Lentisphaeria bacterium]
MNEHRTCNIEHSTSNQAYITSETDDRRQTTDDRVREVREYIRTIRGFKSVRIVERDTNLGLAKSIISGVAEVINEYGRIIVLEDDMVTSPYFLRYMNEALELYEKEDKVISIHGYVYPIQDLPETFFIKGADCWGWATWKRGWDLFEQDGKKLLKKLEDGNLTSEFDNDGAYPYTKMLRDQIRGKNNSWAIRWYASAFLNDKLTLYPGSSLVKNIGLDDSGTHNDSTDYFNVELIGRIPELKNIPMERNLEASRKFRDFLVNIPKPSFFSRIRRKAKRLLN